MCGRPATTRGWGRLGWWARCQISLLEGKMLPLLLGLLALVSLSALAPEAESLAHLAKACVRSTVVFFFTQGRNKFGRRGRGGAAPNRTAASEGG